VAAEPIIATIPRTASTIPKAAVILLGFMAVSFQ
jgi:hypothetical protein